MSKKRHRSVKSSQLPPIAVVGVSALFPGSIDATGFWRDILEGSDLITEVPASHWLVEDYFDADPEAPDKTYARRGAFLGERDFDALGWGVPPSILSATDTSQLLALIVAQKVLEDACQGREIDRSRVSVILGVTSAQELYGTMVARLQRPVWVKALRESGLSEETVQQACDRIADQYVPWQEATFPGLLGNVVAGRIANRLDLGGTNCVTDAACASSFSALAMAANELHQGQSDMVITGGVDAMNDILMYMCFSKTPAMSPTGDCRPFSDQADGTMLGEGLGMVALKRREDAERDGDRIYALLQGVGTSSDGRATSVYAPVPAGQAKALRRAYESAGYGPETVELVEAHGTGTVAGDAAELEGLHTVFSESGRNGQPWCALGSVKSQIGHTKAAAGAAGLFKVVMALHHRVLPPTIKVERPAPVLAGASSPFYVSTQTRPWVRDSSHPRRGSVSSFGFGGSNFHLTLEEYTGPGAVAKRLRSLSCEMVVLTGGCADEVAVQARCRAAESRSGEGYLQWLARTSQEQYDADARYRLAVVAGSSMELGERLERAASLIDRNPEQAISTPDGIHFGSGRLTGNIAFLFPGQGSQYLGMGSDLAVAFPQALAAWDMAADLDCFGDTRLHDVVFPQPCFSQEERTAQEQRLTATEWAQPAIGCTSLALLALLQELGIEPQMTAGHSYGEVTALHAAGLLSALDMLRVARKRGELMAAAAAIPGAMTAVSRPLAELTPLLEQIGADVVVANHNGPSQVVLSGPTEAIARVEEELAKAGTRARRLAVATAFHSPVVAESSAPFLEYLRKLGLGRATARAFANSTAAPYSEKTRTIRQTLAGQIAMPVRFAEMVERIYDEGARTFIEVGPGSVLTGLVGKILEGRQHTALSLDRRGRDGVLSLHDGLARLVAAGLAMRLSALWEGFAEVENPHGRVEPKLSVKISGANYGKPYPPPGGAAELPGPNPEGQGWVVQGREKGRGTGGAANPTATQAEPQMQPQMQQQMQPQKQPLASSLPAPAPNKLEEDVPQTSKQPQAGQAWVDAFQEVQRQTAEAHAAFQQAMAESHSAFLRTAETSLNALSQMLTGKPATEVTVPVQEQAVLAPVRPDPTPVIQSQHRPQPTSQAIPEVEPETPPPTEPQPRNEPVATAEPPAEGVRALLLAVVSEKTGYPAEMLTMEMDLEQDLGIDSIKRVEILSAVVERVPELPEIDSEAMIALRTLGQIVDYLEQGVGALSTVPGPAATLHPDDVRALLLEVVSEKTGYPAEMLAMEMDLEQDLGIDSIKRVEILSSMVERAPQLPEIDAEAMISLRTLGQIAVYLEQSLAAIVSLPGPAQTLQAQDVRPLLLEVVSEKTGYPAEMLAMEMDLEQDLGIDSIKRVEILSAMVERSPELPEVDSETMIGLHTLGQIVEHMQQADAIGAGHSDTCAAETVVSSSDHEPELGRFILQAAPAPPLGMSQPGLLGGTRIYITKDDSGMAQALEAVLSHRGVNAEVVDKVPENAPGVVFLGGLRQVSSIDEAVAINREAFSAAKALAADARLFVTVQDTGGQLGLSACPVEQAFLGGLAGLTKTIGQERPATAVKAIDLERADRTTGKLAIALADELLSGGIEREVGLPSDGRRLTTRLHAAEVEPGSPAIEKGDLIVASGGARGVTAACLLELAKRFKPRLVTLGRTRLTDEPECCRGVTENAGLKQVLLQAAQTAGEELSPAELGNQVRQIEAVREIRSNLEAFEAAGAEVRYLAVDVTDAAALTTTLSEIRQEWGEVKGVIHGAGVIADHLLADKSELEFDLVFGTKVAGLQALLAATADDPLTLLCLFSSVAARSGNPGQADYAMANEVLNKVAAAEQHRRGDQCRVKALGWGPWAGGMVTPQLQAHFEKRGVPLIPVETGAQMLVDEICSQPSELVEIVLGGEMKMPLSAEPADLSLELLVDQYSHPYLVDHSVNGVPVVPMVLVMEWFARATAAMHSELRLTSLRDVQVLRGIKLERFSQGGHRFTVTARQSSGNGGSIALAMTLEGDDGTVYYRATAELSAQRCRTNGAMPQLQLRDWNGRGVYGGTLFHGPQFQVIRAVEGASDEGISATICGINGLAWPSERYYTDAAAIDGGLQLALLWTEQMLGGASLPTSIGEVRTWIDEPLPGELQVLLRGCSAQNGRAVSDIYLKDQQGQLVAVLNQVETHLLPAATN
jgi:acyl transferase domain-containing protein/short-subunit dehydrogenase